MKWLIGALAVAVLATRSLAACSGDCGGDGEVTVDELIIGVNIALGTGSLGQCGPLDSSGDGEVTIDELVAAVSQALNGCGQNVAGDYSGTLTIEAGHYGIVNLNVNASNQVNGNLTLTTTQPSRSRFQPHLSFTFPVAGASVALSGVFDPVAGGFEVSGSFIDGSGATVPVVISGNTAGLSGAEAVNLYLGTDVFPVTLSPGMFATPTPTPSPTPSPGNGPRLVYSGGILDIGIFVINTDGTGKLKIHTPTVGVVSNPAWSPDGSKIAFVSPDDQNRGLGIAVMNADGSNAHLLGDTSLDGNPAWSPDGSQISLTAGGGDAIDVMNADGSNRHRILSKDAGEAFGHMSWSPDGSRIAFESTRPRQMGSESRWEIWVANADGSNPVRLTNNDVPDRRPDWSPNGQKIVFERANTFQGGVMSINPDGTGEVRLVNDPFGGSAPNWSRDGQSLAYTTIMGIKIANASGSNAMAVPNTSFNTDFDLK